MKIVRILGGLGNQMWQYAFLVSLRNHFPNDEVMYDAGFFNGYHLHNGFELTRIYNITAQQAPKQEIRRLYHYFNNHYLFTRLYRHYFPLKKTEVREVEMAPYRPEIFETNGDYYYDGYWADPIYYDGCRDELLKEFSLKEPLDKTNNDLLSAIKNKTTCSIHVRRGDNMKDPDYSNICNVRYYKRAIDIILQSINREVTFLVFSDDIEWCREHLPINNGSYEVIYVDWNRSKDSYKDMYLMSQCQLNIIANSSFSWWGAYLNKNKGKIVISPEKYKNIEIGFKVALDDWICI